MKDLLKFLSSKILIHSECMYPSKPAPILLIVFEIPIVNLKRPIEGSGAEEVGNVFISTLE